MEFLLLNHNFLDHEIVQVKLSLASPESTYQCSQVLVQVKLSFHYSLLSSPTSLILDTEKNEAHHIVYEGKGKPSRSIRCTK
jgi:hypothetical protein